MYLFFPDRFLCCCLSWTLEWIGKFKILKLLYLLFQARLFNQYLDINNFLCVHNRMLPLRFTLGMNIVRELYLTSKKRYLQTLSQLLVVVNLGGKRKNLIPGSHLHVFQIDIMKRLRHPNVLLFMGAAYTQERLSIVTEFLPR